jgi:error-prone DNA polymerase
MADLVNRSGASRATLARLAAADAFPSLGLNRRQAVWKVLALGNACDEEESLFAGTEPSETRPDLPELSKKDVVLADYNTTGLSLNAHPMSLIRSEMDQIQVQQNRMLQTARHGQWIRVAGIVLVRQRPSTANGIVFCTIEDETAVANLIIRPSVYTRYRRVAGGAAAIIVDGRVERCGDVIHINAACIRDATKGLAQLRGISRDFQ